jgi:hypothetical protein
VDADEEIPTIYFDPDDPAIGIQFADFPFPN